jgi:dihydrofolate reductase
MDAEMSELISAGIARADAILLGPRTYLDMARIWPTQGSDVPMADFMNNTPKYVLSSTLGSADWGDTRVLRGSLIDEVTALKNRPGRDIQVPGSPRLVRSLLQAGRSTSSA